MKQRKLLKDNRLLAGRLDRDERKAGELEYRPEPENKCEENTRNKNIEALKFRLRKEMVMGKGLSMILLAWTRVRR